MSQPVTVTPAAPLRPRLYGFVHGAFLATATLLFGLVALAGALTHTGLGSWVDALLGIVAAVVVLGVPSLLIQRVAWAVRRLRHAPPGRPGVGGDLFGMLAVGASCVGFLGLIGGAPLGIAWPFYATIVLAAALLGAAVGTVYQYRGKRGPRWFLGVMTVVDIAMMAGLFYRPGYTAGAPGWQGPVAVAQSTAPDPSQQGPYQVSTLTYGSGVDRLRPEYGAGVTLQTESVDITPITSGVGGFAGRVRDLLWGFTFRHVPLNGRVWYPEGSGPFPLVVMAHGNHDDGDFSDPGYAYLGELLASRGFIFVSVDENFLNGSNLLGQPPHDMPARAYLLLRHVGLWQEWNAAPGNPFTGKVDGQQIALMGHSRGGEAAALAAVMNDQTLYRDNAALALDFHYPIKAVVALAPSDGLYQGDTWLKNINYLVLQGGRDTDAHSFPGMKQYQRVQFTDGGDWLKAAVWFDHVNHGQLNTGWIHDRTLPTRLWYNESSLMAGDDARQIVKTYISAFLATTLQGQNEYRAFLADPAVGAGWLPETAYAGRYQDASFAPVADYEEDFDPHSTRMGGSISFADLAVEERYLDLRKGTRRGTRGAELSWQAGAVDPYYTINLPQMLSLPADGRLSFALGNRTTRPVIATVEAADAQGNRAGLSLSRYADLVPVPTHSVTLGGILDQPFLGVGAWDVMLQTVTVPLADFPALGPVVSITLRFDAAGPGSVVLDDVGFSAGR